MIDVTYRYKGVMGTLTVINPETEQRLRELYDKENLNALIEELSCLVLPNGNAAEHSASLTLPAEPPLSEICISVNSYSFLRLV